MTPRLLACCLCAAMVAFHGATLAQGYPVKPVRMVVPFPAGGATDIVARLIAQKLTESFGQHVIVDNRAGAGGTIGSDNVAKSPPDGYTMLMATSSTHAIAKKQPNALSFASSGNGGVSHLVGEHFKSVAGVQMLHVPYREGVETVIARSAATWRSRGARNSVRNGIASSRRSSQ